MTNNETREGWGEPSYPGPHEHREVLRLGLCTNLGFFAIVREK